MATHYPLTMAVRALRDAKVEFSVHLYDYEEKGGTASSSAALQIDEHRILKTLVMEDEKKHPLIVLMHGDCEVSTKNLARFLNCKSITPCMPETANKHSGYLVGGTSPFGTKRTMPIYLERTALDCETIFINGGKRGFLVGIKPSELVRVLNPTLVDVKQL